MPYNGSGTFLRVMDWEADRDAGIKIRADRHDQEDDNFAAGLSNVITKDGQTQPTAHIPMNGKRLINLGAPTSGTDATTKTYVDSIKKFINDIEVTDTVYFKDGSTTRGYITAAIGTGVAGKLTFEADNDAGTLVNRMALESVGLNLRAGGYRLTPGDILRGSVMAETSATVGINLRAYDAAGVEKNLVSVGSNFIALRPMDPAVTSSTFRFVTSDNVIRAVITSDGSQTDGKISFDIRNGSGTVRNSMGLDINGLSLTTGKFSAPIWDFPSGTVTVDGNISVTNNVQFIGTSASVGAAILYVRDARATTGAAGNAVLAIKRQNSSTDALIFGNDGNSDALIGHNNTNLRLGKWVSGVFTEYMNISSSGKISITGDLEVDPTAAVTGIRILPSDTNSGRLFLEATTQKWSVTAWESNGDLIFSYGGTYGSATGTNRVRFSSIGEAEFSNFVTAGYEYRLTRGYLTETRAKMYVNASGQLELHRIDADGTTTSNRQLFGTNAVAWYGATGGTSYVMRIANPAGQRRIDLSYSTTNPFALVARSDSDVVLASIVANSSGVPFWTYGSGTTSEIITVASLNLTTYTGSSASNLDFPVGEEIMMYTNGVAVSRNASATPCLSNNDTIYYRLSGQPNAGSALAGTWRARGHIDSNWVAMRRTA